jgi:phosphoglycolate phosphatase
MEKHGYPVRTKDEVKMDVGNGVARLVENSLPCGKNTPDFNAILEEYIVHYKANMFNKTAPFPGIPGLLLSLKKKGYKLAVVSNKLDSAVRELNQKYFSETIRVAIGQSESVKKKPAPDSVFTALRQLGATADQAVYVGDSEVDIKTAQNAGLMSVGVTWGFRDRSVLSEAGADHIIHVPEELLSTLEG